MLQELTRQEELQSIYWDMYKDAYGVRPRGIDTSNWTEHAFNTEFEYLASVIKMEELARKESESKAIVAFEKRVQDLLAIGAKDRAMALRWIHEAEDTHGDDEYLCYTVGLPYRYFAQTCVQ
jgi:hypothetical protein